MEGKQRPHVFVLVGVRSGGSQVRRLEACFLGCTFCAASPHQENTHGFE